MLWNWSYRLIPALKERKEFSKKKYIERERPEKLEMIERRMGSISDPRESFRNQFN